MENKNNRIVMTISVPEWMVENIQADAKKNELTVSEFIRYLYVKYKSSYGAITGGIKNGK